MLCHVAWSRTHRSCCPLRICFLRYLGSPIRLHTINSTYILLSSLPVLLPTPARSDSATMQVLTRPTWAIALGIFSVSFTQVAHAASSSSPQSPKTSEIPCTVQSSTTGAYFDLNPIALAPPELKDGRKIHKSDRDESWQAQGYDYGANFTLNICAPVIENIQDVVGVDESRWQNVSAYYEHNDKIYSIG